MLNTISHQRGRGWVKRCCKRHSGNPAPVTASSHCQWNREAVAGPGYLIPPQDLLEGMEREQLAAGIRKKGTATDRGHASLSPSAQKTCTVGDNVSSSLITLTHKTLHTYNIPTYSWSLAVDTATHTMCNKDCENSFDYKYKGHKSPV